MEKNHIKKGQIRIRIVFFPFQEGSRGRDREETIVARQQIVCQSLNENNNKKKWKRINGTVCTYNFSFVIDHE
jgi:hypothetical protein